MVHKRIAYNVSGTGVLLISTTNNISDVFITLQQFVSLACLSLYFDKNICYNIHHKNSLNYIMFNSQHNTTPNIFMRIFIKSASCEIPETMKSLNSVLCLFSSHVLTTIFAFSFSLTFITTKNQYKWIYAVFFFLFCIVKCPSVLLIVFNQCKLIAL